MFSECSVLHLTRELYHVTVVAIKRQVKLTTDESGEQIKEVVTVPSGEAQILADDVLVLMGSDDRIDGSFTGTTVPNTTSSGDAGKL